MARDWDALFESWKSPPSDTEQNRAEAIRAAITKAVVNSSRFASLHPKFLLHGSYGNNTNVRLNSDVDVAIIITDYLVEDLSQIPGGASLAEVGLVAGNGYNLATARHDVEAALREAFGSTRVQGKNKAIHVQESPGHLEADVIACFERRRYYSKSKTDYRSGICFKPLTGEVIENWPEQAKANMNAKADATSRRYKKVVRILKKLTFEMAYQGHAIAKKIPGCLIESLVYNVPNDQFVRASLRKDVRAVVATIYNEVREDRAGGWVETNGLKWLFNPTQKWTKDDVVAWSYAAWSYAELDKA